MNQANHRRHALLQHLHQIADVSGLQAALDALQDAIDAIDPVVSAENVTYDNSLSGLTAEDVQAAIDELAAMGGPVTTEGFPPQLAWAGIR